MANCPYLSDKEWQVGSAELWKLFNGMIPKLEFMLDEGRRRELMDVLSVREQLTVQEKKLLTALPKNRISGRPSAEQTMIAGYFWDVQTIAAVFGKDWRRSMRAKMKKAAEQNQSLGFNFATLNRPNVTLDQKPTILQSF